MSPIGLFAAEGVVVGASLRARGSRSPEAWGSYAAKLGDLDVLDATFSRPDLDAFCRLDPLGLTVVGQQLDGRRAVLACHVREPIEHDRWCRGCGGAGRVRDSVVRRLAHVPFG